MGGGGAGGGGGGIERVKHNGGIYIKGGRGACVFENVDEKTVKLSLGNGLGYLGSGTGEGRHARKAAETAACTIAALDLLSDVKTVENYYLEILYRGLCGSPLLRGVCEDADDQFYHMHRIMLETGKGFVKK